MMTMIANQIIEDRGRFWLAAEIKAQYSGSYKAAPCYSACCIDKRGLHGKYSSQRATKRGRKPKYPRWGDTSEKAQKRRAAEKAAAVTGSGRR